MSEMLLTAETGRQEGTRPSRRLRRQGQVPAVVYGLDAPPVSISVAWPALRSCLTTEAGLNALITLELEGNKHLCIIKDLQRHPVRRDVIHIDFMQVRADQEIEVEVPLVLIGEALEVTRADGMVDQTIYSLTILVKPTEVPDELKVDISEIELGGSIKVADLVLPAGVSTMVDGEEAIATALITRSTREAIARSDEADAEADDTAASGANAEISDN